MEFFARIADSFRQYSLDIHVDIFRLYGKLYLSRFYIFPDLSEGICDLRCFFLRNDSLFGQHLCVDDASGYVFLVKSLVEFDGSVEFISG